MFWFQHGYLSLALANASTGWTLISPPEIAMVWECDSFGIASMVLGAAGVAAIVGKEIIWTARKIADQMASRTLIAMD